MNLEFHCPMTQSDLDVKNNCFLCRKTLVDCRDKSTDEIYALQSVKSFCGIYSPNQISNGNSSLLKAAFRMAFVCVFLFGWSSNDLFAQSDSITVRNEIVKDSMITFTGSVRDQDGELIPFARVVVGHDSLLYFARSDFDGNYSISVPKEALNNSTIMQCSFVGCEKVEVKLNEILNQQYNFILGHGSAIICGIIINDGIRNPFDPYDFNKHTFSGDDIRW